MRARNRTSLRGLPLASRSALGAVVAALTLVVSLLVPAPVSATVLPAAGPVKAAAVTGFDPENIISDALFYDGAAMTAAQIQSFLDEKIGSCSNGKCLNVASASISSRGAVVSQTTGNLICSAIQGGTMRVSELIYRVQTACGISAKVILVTLQKEQGLTTSTAPSEWNLQAAMGASCPDDAPCDPAFSGLGPQILKGTQQLKTYRAANFAKQPGRHYIGYNPTSSCGGTTLTIRNYATAALYNYTPYQPNAAALAAGWGLGDGCSSYGNRNFFNNYTPYQPNAAALAAGWGLGDGCSSYGNRNFFNYYTRWFGGVGAALPCTAPAASAIAPAGGMFVTSTSDVNARTAPTTACDTGVRALAQGTPVARLGVYNGWAQVRVDGAVMWIHGDLLTPVSDLPAPSVALDEGGSVLALATDGAVLAYPLTNGGRWGDAVALTAASAMTRIVEIGDFDGDGHRDLIGIDSDRSPLLLRGDGTSLTSSTRLSADWTGQSLLTAAGDFDGDGVADVFSVDGAGRLLLWRGDGSGAFRKAISIGQGWGGMTALAGGGDFTGDGKADLLARDAAGRLYRYAGDGAGGWSSGGQIGVGWSSMLTLISAGDVTGDGRDDLLARDATGGLHVYPGVDTGLTYLAQIGVGWGGMRAIVGSGPDVGPVRVRAGGGPGAGDLNGDGNPDVAALSAQGLLLYTGNGAGGWKGSSVLDGSWATSDRIVPIGDFTGDGIRDLGRIRADGAFTLSAGLAGGGIGAATAIGSGWGSLTEVFGAIDFDGDGNGDVIARAANGDLLLYRGNGAGGWASGGAVIGTGWGPFDRIFGAGDFDGDGRSDVLARTTGGDLWLYPTTGTGGWKSPRQVGVGWSAFTSVFSPGNFDGAAGPDVLARTAGGDLYLYRGDGKAGWLGGGQIGVGWSGMTQLQ